MLHMFCDICIKAVKRCMRPNTYFNKVVWKFIIHALIFETGVGWSRELETISATDEWWKAKISGNEMKIFFSHYRIEPSLCAKHDIIFGNIVAVRQYVWTPLQRVLPDEDDKGAKLRNMNNYEINLEGSGDFKEDTILDFVHDVSNIIGGCNASSRGDHFRFGFYKKK
ncbi:hypothetical protein NC651_002993 [Populus alba x Populus x berolinensis]|nr:hypothetical protein NC651_002993 [Populus alba x Populus x berolinensis]